jgi:pSer/pThr/pTyr-binding forkhead associated (FHA) protein
MVSQKSSDKTGLFVVEIMSGPEDGRLIECSEFPIAIGRAEDNLIQLSYDHLVSRHHARVEKTENTLVLRDLNSTNGTFIHNRRVRGHLPIKANKLFRVGATLLSIRLHTTKD